MTPEQPWQRGDRVVVWPGARPDGRTYEATVIDPGPHFFGSVATCRIRKDDGGTDYIALTHVARREARRA